MKLHTTRSPVESEGVERSAEFQIRTSAKAFEILSSGIYSDPILAIIRELSSNAWDAHVSANKADVPFRVHLPNSLEPWFAVNDDGIGLAEDEVFGLYTTYFDSTKTNSNDFIGALGLGSKSPFSYATAFEVTSRYNGKKTLYSIHLNENGVPTVAKMAEVDYVGSNGLEVKLSVKSSDFYAFAEKTKEALRFFDPLPEISGNEVEFEPVPANAIRGDKYIAWPNYSYYRYKNFVAVQGAVQYQVDLEQIRDRNGNTADWEFMESFNVVGFFDIGELEVAASREEIRYDKRTVENLLSLLKNIRLDYLKRVDDETTNIVQKTKSRWEAYRALNEKMGHVRDGQVVGDFKFTSSVVSEWIEDYGNVRIEAPAPKGKGQKAQKTPETYELLEIRHARYNRSKKIHSTSQYSVAPDEHGIVIIDVKQGYSDRMAEYLSNNGLSEVYALKAIQPWQVRKKNPKLTTDKKELQKIYADDLKTVLKLLGDPPTVNLSDHTSAPSRISKGNRRKGIVTKKWDSAYSSTASCSPKWLDNDVLDVDPNKTYLYVPIDLYGKVMDSDGNTLSMTHGKLGKMINAIITLINKHEKTKYWLYGFRAKDKDDKGLDAADRVIGLTKKSQKMVADMKNVVCIFDKAKEYAGNYQYVLDYNAQYRASTIESRDVRDVLGLTISYPNIVDIIDKTGLDELLKELDTESEFRKTFEAALNTRKRILKDGITLECAERVRYALSTYYDAKATLPLKDGTMTPFFEKDSFIKKYGLVLALDRSLVGSKAGREILLQAIKSCEE